MAANNLLFALNSHRAAFSCEGRKNKKEVLISYEDEALLKGISVKSSDDAVFFESDKKRKEYKGFS
jgi:hypothetical protein